MLDCRRIVHGDGVKKFVDTVFKGKELKYYEGYSGTKQCMYGG